MPRCSTLLCLFMFTVTVSAQTPPGQIRDLPIPRIRSRPRLEEFLNGNARADMKRVDDFRQRQPGDGVPASRTTSAWLGYDDEEFYVVFVCREPPGQTRAPDRGCAEGC